jgi:hypothetical protein
LPRLEGPAFAGPTHLHLIVASAPPTIVDVDTGAVRAVPGVTTSPFSQVRLVPIAGGALAIVHQACDPCVAGSVRYATNAIGFRIRLDGSIERLGSGRSFVPARSSTAVWVLARDAGDHCSLRLEPSLRPARRIPCGVLLADEDAGLRMSTPDGEAFLDARTGLVRAAGGGGRILARDDFAIRLSGDGVRVEQRLHVDHLASGESRRVRWPSVLKWYGGWAQQPGGRLVALEFGDPAYPGPAQAEDFWLLDTATRKFSHLPGFPAQVRLKASSWAWSDDGRLVLLLEGGGRTVVAVWQPRSQTLPLVPVSFPVERIGQFVLASD